MKKRRKAREYVLQGLYASEISGNPYEVILEEISAKSEDPEVYQQRFSGYLKKQKIDPLKLGQHFSATLKSIENSI